MLRKIALFTAALFCLVSFGLFGPNASQISAAVDPACDKSATFLSFPTWYKYLDVTVVDGHCEVTGPKGDDGKFDWSHNLGRIGLAVAEIALRVAGLVAVAFVIYGGFRYILSQGDPQAAVAARHIIINSLIGMVLAILATAIVSLIAGSLT